MTRFTGQWTEALARQAYTVLQEEVGASDQPDAVNQFVYHVVRGTPEYRFQGSLGFGGKFWPGGNRVTCYKEDDTPERREAIDRTNQRLQGLAPSCPSHEATYIPWSFGEGYRCTVCATRVRQPHTTRKIRGDDDYDAIYPIPEHRYLTEHEVKS